MEGRGKRGLRLFKGRHKDEDDEEGRRSCRISRVRKVKMKKNKPQ